MLSVWKKINKKLEIIARYVSMVSLVLIVGVNTTNILLRIFKGYSIQWNLEVSLLAFIYMVFFGIVIVYYENGMIIMTVIIDKCSIKARKILKVFSEFCIMFFLVIFIINSFHFESFIRFNLTPGLEISRSFTVIPLIFAGIFMLMINLHNLFINIKTYLDKTYKEVNYD